MHFSIATAQASSFGPQRMLLRHQLLGQLLETPGKIIIFSAKTPAIMDVTSPISTVAEILQCPNSVTSYILFTSCFFFLSIITFIYHKSWLELVTIPNRHRHKMKD